MGRRFQGGEAAQQSNVVYFPKPTVLTIGEEGPPPFKTASVGLTNCRLKSSQDDVNCVIPAEIEYTLSERPQYQEVTEYLRMMEIKGYGEGAIVARRYSRPRRWKYPSQWGLIMTLRRHAGGSAPYAPYIIKWFDSAEGFEPAWAEDLIIIHPCLDDNYLLDIVESQGMVVER